MIGSGFIQKENGVPCCLWCSGGDEDGSRHGVSGGVEIGGVESGGGESDGIESGGGEKGGGERSGESFGVESGGEGGGGGCKWWC